MGYLGINHKYPVDKLNNISLNGGKVEMLTIVQELPIAVCVFFLVSVEQIKTFVFVLFFVYVGEDCHETDEDCFVAFLDQFEEFVFSLLC